jgi:uncharacterized protein (TIGR03118 family)
MRRSTLATCALAAALALNLGTTTKVNAGGYIETDLVTDLPTLIDKNGISHTGKVQDPNLVNPWGVAESKDSPFWVSNNNAGVATLYNVPGANNTPVSINGLVVRIPTPVDRFGNSGAPTGAVFNIAQGAGAFPISGIDPNVNPTSGPAVFLFATEDGTIVGWNPNIGLSTLDFNGPNGVSTRGIIALDNSGNNFTNPDPNSQTGAVYKGLAIATDANGQTRLYVTNFRSGKVEMYTGGFMSSPPAFVDPKGLPDSYAPFNIVLINGVLVVTYAVQNGTKHDDVAGQGHGIVDVFELDGTFRQRFAQHGQLDSPWVWQSRRLGSVIWAAPCGSETSATATSTPTILRAASLLTRCAMARGRRFSSTGCGPSGSATAAREGERTRFISPPARMTRRTACLAA